MSKVTIASFFEERWQAYEKDKKQVAEENAIAAKERADVQARLALLGKELKEKNDRRSAATEEGLDTAPLDKRIKELEKEQSTLQKKEQSFASQSSFSELKEPFDRYGAKKAAAVLEETYKIAEAACIEDHAQAFAFAAAKLTPDENGSPESVTVSFGGTDLAKLKIESSSTKYVRGFHRPKALQWVPPLPGEKPEMTPMAGEHDDAEVPNGVAALISVKRQTLIVPRPVAWTTERKTGRWVNSSYGGGSYEETERVQHGFAAPCVVPMTELVKEDVAESGGVLNLAKEYKKSPFLETVRKKVLAATTDTSRWKAAIWVESGTQPNSVDTHSMIKDDWALLAAAPWESDLDGVWAKLKYTVENGERPRFWCEWHADNYGFRIRTRDHTWLFGSLFIDTTQKCAKAGSAMTWHNEGKFAQIGRMYIWVYEYRDK